MLIGRLHTTEDRKINKDCVTGLPLVRGGGGVCVSQHAMGQTPLPPVNRITDTCKT